MNIFGYKIKINIEKIDNIKIGKIHIHWYKKHNSYLKDFHLVEEKICRCGEIKISREFCSHL